MALSTQNWIGLSLLGSVAVYFVYARRSASTTVVVPPPATPVVTKYSGGSTKPSPPTPPSVTPDRPSAVDPVDLGSPSDTSSSDGAFEEYTMPVTAGLAAGIPRKWWRYLPKATASDLGVTPSRHAYPWYW